MIKVYECAKCHVELKAVDGKWWHVAESGDYQPANHAAAPVPREVTR